MKNRSVKSNAVLNVIKNCCNIIIPLITYPYVTRVLGSNNFGKYSFAESVVSIALIFASLGIPTYAVREGARIRNEKERINKFCSEIFSINILSTGITLLGVFLLVSYVHKMQENGSLIMILSINIFAFCVGRDWINSIFEDYVFITVRYLIFHLISTALIFLLVHAKDDYIIYTWIMLFGNAAGYLANVFYSNRYSPYGISLKRDVLKHLKPIMYLFGVTIAIQIYIRSDIVILGLLRSDSEVGVYALVAKVYTIIKTLLNAVITVSIPRISNYLGTNKLIEAERLLNKLKNTLVTFVFPCIVGLILQAQNVLRIIGGSDYTSGSNSLKILCFAMGFAVFGCFYAQAILVPNRREKIFFIATCVSASVNIILNVVLIPILGIEGASITTVVAEFLVFFICYVKTRDLFTTDEKRRRQYSSVFLGCIMIIIICKAIHILDISVFLDFALSVILSAILYFFTLLIMRNELATELIAVLNKIMHKPLK